MQITRTSKGKQLPVYSDIRNGGTRTITVVRRVTGDTQFLAEELRRLTGGAEVEVKIGKVEVEGNRVAHIRNWLGGLGF